ncbi:MAG: transcriptional regulator [Lactobacillus sp.]|nr:transcriptional regulator [Lactobacillus sp.]
MANSNNLKYNFAQNLQRLLYENNEKGRHLAQALGVSNPTVSSWINQTSFPRSQTLQKIADHFGISVSQLTTAPTDKDEVISYLKHFDNSVTDTKGSTSSLLNELQKVNESAVFAYDGTQPSQQDIAEIKEAIIGYQGSRTNDNELQAKKNSPFKEKLHYLRKKQKLSLKALAGYMQEYYNGKVTYDVNKVWRLETGASEPTLKDAEAISYVLHTPIAFLTDNPGKSSPYIDLANDTVQYTWNGKLIPGTKISLIRAFIAGQMNDSNFKI